MCDLWIWEVDYHNLREYFITDTLPKTNFLVVRYFNTAREHLITFYFMKDSKSKILKLKSINDSHGKLILKDYIKYTPYPGTLTKLVKQAYGDDFMEDPYFIYDPITTLGAFKAYTNQSNTQESKDIIKRKLIADLTFNENCKLISKEMNTNNLRKWIEENV